MEEKMEAMNQIDSLAMGFRQRLKHKKSRPSLKSQEVFYEIMAKYFSSVADSKKEKKPLVFCGHYIPVELFQAMDIAYLMKENFILVFVSQGKGFEFFDVCDGYGIASDSCSLHKMAMGMAKADALPRPDLIINSGQMCDPSERSLEIIRNLYNCPGFMFDDTYQSCYDEERIGYVKREIRDLIRFLEGHTNRRLDYDKLREIITLSRPVWQYWWEICEMRKSVPSPFGAREGFRDYGAWLVSIGTPEGLRYFEQRHQEGKEKIGHGEGVVPEEKYRLAWWGQYPNFALNLFDWMAIEYGAVVVLEEHMGVVYLPPSKKRIMETLMDTPDPLEYLARRVTMMGGLSVCSPYNSGFGEATKRCQEFNVNGSIFYIPLGCKNMGGVIKSIKDDQAKMGIPTLILDGDAADPRIVPISQMKTKIDEYFTMLEGR